MQLGFVSAILDDCSLEETLATAAKIGFDCVELMCWPPGKAQRRYAGVTHVDVTTLDEAAIDVIGGLCEKHGIAISGLGYYPNPLSPQAEESTVAVEHLQKVIAAAPRLGLDRVNTFVGRDPSRSIDDNWDAFLATWKPIVNSAEQQGVRIGIENCPMWFTDDEWPGGKNLATSPATWARMFEDLPSEHFGLNYDPSHMIWQQMDYLKPIREFSDKLFHIHAKDVRLDREKLDRVGITANPNLYHTPKLPGLGDVDWGSFFSVLTDTGYRGPVCVEVEDRAYEGTRELREQSLVQSCVYLRNYIPASEAESNTGSFA
ncbi:MAG: sugar phosphate isomerase/epimerase family protein [Planctomycetota bacterium]|nr:sugar phosphate isomerase/epimerase family protein [Planctomycetota bacterium]